MTSFGQSDSDNAIPIGEPDRVLAGVVSHASEFLRNTSTATGVPIHFTWANNGEPVQCAGVIQSKSLCRRLSLIPNGRCMCDRVRTRLGRDAKKGNLAAIPLCIPDLRLFVAPVYIEDKLEGFIIGGPVIEEPGTTLILSRSLHSLSSNGIPISESELTEHLSGFASLPSERFEAVARMCEWIAGTSTGRSLCSGRSLSKQLSVDIRRAGEFIRLRAGEKLTLKMLAKHIGLSPSYLSHRFKEEIGMSFCEFLARCRVANAQALLAKPDVRVIDVAFAVGFGSLAQFNRIFRRVTGGTPTQYIRRPKSARV